MNHWLSSLQYSTSSITQQAYSPHVGWANIVVDIQLINEVKLFQWIDVTWAVCHVFYKTV